MAAPEDPSTLEELLAIEAIRRLKARYCRFVDTRQWEQLKELFTPDAHLEGFGSVPDGSDPATFVAGVAKRLARAITIHHVHCPEISLLKPELARGMWPIMDHVEFEADPQPAEQPTARGWIGWGYYEEEYVRIGNTWRISFMRLARQRMDELTADHPKAKPGRRRPDIKWL